MWLKNYKKNSIVTEINKKAETRTMNINIHKLYIHLLPSLKLKLV